MGAFAGGGGGFVGAAGKEFLNGVLDGDGFEVGSGALVNLDGFPQRALAQLGGGFGPLGDGGKQGNGVAGLAEVGFQAFERGAGVAGLVGAEGKDL